MKKAFGDTKLHELQSTKTHFAAIVVNLNVCSRASEISRGKNVETGVGLVQNRCSGQAYTVYLLTCGSFRMVVLD